MAFTTFVNGTTADADKVNDNFDYFVKKDNIMAVFNQTQADGGDGGTFTTGAWRTRVLDTEQFNNLTGCSLAANQVTLGAGTYYVSASASAYKVGKHQTQLYNITDAETTLLGTSEGLFDDSGAQNRSFITGVFTIAGATVFELQHQCQLTVATIGFGYGSDFGSDVFATITIMRLA